MLGHQRIPSDIQLYTPTHTHTWHIKAQGNSTWITTGDLAFDPWDSAPQWTSGSSGSSTIGTVCRVKWFAASNKVYHYHQLALSLQSCIVSMLDPLLSPSAWQRAKKEFVIQTYSAIPSLSGINFHQCRRWHRLPKQQTTKIDWFNTTVLVHALFWSPNLSLRADPQLMLISMAIINLRNRSLGKHIPCRPTCPTCCLPTWTHFNFTDMQI